MQHVIEVIDLERNLLTGIWESTPVHQFHGQWYFWNETWSHRIGPYLTKESAYIGLNNYVAALEEEESRNASRN